MDCRHWAKNPLHEEAGGICLLISARTKHEWSQPYQGVHSKANAMSGGGMWSGHLRTDADFGCVEFEQKH